MGGLARVSAGHPLDFVEDVIAKEFPELSVADRLDVLAIAPAAARELEGKAKERLESAPDAEKRLACLLKAARNAARATMQRRDPFAFAAWETARRTAANA